LKTWNYEYYGDDIRWFVANVIDNTPPYGLEGRVQIRIHGIHTDNTDKTGIPQRDLPWAQVMNPGDTYGVSGLGTSAQILPGALVFGFFLDGATSQLPLVLGSLPRIEFPTTVQASNREDMATNPFTYEFNQSNAEAVDPILTTSARPAGDVARYFIDNGFNAKQASSITGVLDEISGLDPNNVSNGVGIAGWIPNSPRYNRFYAYIRRLAPARDASDFEGQLLYVLHELKTARSIAMSKLIRAREIEGSLYGAKIDGIEEKGNGMVAALSKYYVDSRLAYSEGSAISKAKAIYGGLGAR